MNRLRGRCRLAIRSIPPRERRRDVARRQLLAGDRPRRPAAIRRHPVGAADRPRVVGIRRLVVIHRCQVGTRRAGVRAAPRGRLSLRGKGAVGWDEFLRLPQACTTYRGHLRIPAEGSRL